MSKMSFGIPCAFHSEEIITNFCKSPNCLLPLCPKCIKLHLDQHLYNQQEPIIERYFLPQSIDVSLKQVENNLLNLEKTLHRTGQELADVQSEKQKIRMIISKKLKDARNRIVKQVDRYMYQLEEQITHFVLDFNEGFYFDLKNIDNQLRDKIARVWSMLEGLTNQKCMKTLIQFYSTDFTTTVDNQYQALQERIDQLNNKTFDLTFDQKQIVNLRNCLQQFVKISSVDKSMIKMKNQLMQSESKKEVEQKKKMKENVKTFNQQYPKKHFYDPQDRGKKI